MPLDLALLNSTDWQYDSLASPGTTGALSNLLEGVMRSLASQNSRRAYRTCLLSFLSWCRASGKVTSFSRLLVLQYKDSLIATRVGSLDSDPRKFSTATVNLRLAAVRALAQEAADQGLLDQNEAAAIRRVRGERISTTRVGTWVTKEKVDEAFRLVDRDTLKGKRDYALLAILFATGLRRRELVELDVSVIQERDGQWALFGVKGKGGKLRNINLPEWVRMATNNWLQASDIHIGPIFRSISRHGRISVGMLTDESIKLILSDYMKRVGFPDFRPHDARRTCARLCRTGNAKLEDIRDLLGHSSIQTTERYLGKTGSLKLAINDVITDPSNSV